MDLIEKDISFPHTFEFLRLSYIYRKVSSLKRNELWRSSKWTFRALEMRPSGSIRASIPCQKLRQFKLSKISHVRRCHSPRSSPYTFSAHSERKKSVYASKKTDEGACKLLSALETGRKGRLEIHERFAIGSPLPPRALGRLLIVATAKRFEFKVDLISAEFGSQVEINVCRTRGSPGDLARV